MDVGVEFLGFEMEKGRGETWEVARKDFMHALGKAIEQAFAVIAAIIIGREGDNGRVNSYAATVFRDVREGFDTRGHVTDMGEIEQ